jgi:alpha-1,2-mannosyltransferase
MASRARTIRVALDTVAIAMIVLYVATIAVRYAGGQWDFRSYTTAARVALSGVDPYVPSNLELFAGRMTLPFIYPPFALLAFLPLAMLPLPVAGAAWMLLKLALLGGLVLLWRRWFLPGAALMPLVMLTIFGWNAAAIWDLQSGNFSLVECALLWSAFACFVNGRRTWFAALVVVAASFKLTPAVFLLLLLVPTGREQPEPGRFALAVVALLALLAISFAWANFSGWEFFLTHLPPAYSIGPANPSALAFLLSLAVQLGFGPITDPVAAWTWAAAGVVLLAFSAPALLEAWRRKDARLWVMLAVFLYVLLSPRVMAYGFVLLIPAPLYFAPRPFDHPIGKFALVLMLCIQGFMQATNQVSDWVPLAPIVLTLLLWPLCVLKLSEAALRLAKPVPILRR